MNARIGQVVAPLVVAALGLGGALAATLSLSRTAASAVERVLHERLVGAGESAAALLDPTSPPSEGLRAVMRSNDLEAAYVVGPDLRVLADAGGVVGRRADLLRLDAARVARALRGDSQVAPGYVLGTLTVMTGYFPIRRAQGQPVSVLVLEAGQMFVAAAGRIAHARTVAILLALLFAAALAVITARWTRAERERRQAGTRAARGELLSRLAAMAAHEIRNPLGVIRGTVELMLERSAATLTERDHVALGDINDEVERLRRLTQDLLSLASDKPLSADPLAVGDLLADVARATEAAFPAVKIRCDIGPLPVVDADGGLLRQALLNLLGNAAQAQGTGDVKLRAATHGDTIRIAIQDQGPGVPPDVGDRIFDLYFTTKSGGTGLGLAIARRIAERHGGRLSLAPTPGPGATFVLDLPVRSPVRDRDDNDRPEKG